MFQLTAKEKSEVITNCDRLAPLKFAKALPFAFTEHGAIMAARVLNSVRAVAMSVYVVRAFLQLREQLTINGVILRRLTEIDKSLLQHDSVLRDIYRKLLPPFAACARTTETAHRFQQGQVTIRSSLYL